MITLITTSYKYGRYLPRLVQSAYDQTDPNWRLLIMDDASDDPATITALEDAESLGPDIQVVRSDKNVGNCATIAKALKLVETEYCAILDSDNFWLPGYVEAMLLHLEDMPDFVAVHCAFAQYVDMKPTGVVIQKTPITLENSLDSPPGTTLAAMRTKVARKSLPKYGRCPDFDMMLRLVEKGPVGYDSAPLVGWEDHRDSLWWADMDKSLADVAACKKAALRRRRKKK
jgi:glycosyltransferase involved in cell wall biosynthesis